MSAALALLGPVTGCLLAPLLPGIINRTKSVLTGRKGPPLYQLYLDLSKLLRKGPAYSRTTTWVFRAGPIVSLAAVALCLFFLPFGNLPAPLAFAGDLVLFAYLMGLARFFTVCAALDTGSAFEGMGASREVQFAALIEPGLLLVLAAVAIQTDSWSLTAMIKALSLQGLALNVAVYGLIAVVLLIVFLTENARIPVDDPNTHLELTMVHEGMLLEATGPRLALLTYASELKLVLVAGLFAAVFLPAGTAAGADPVALVVAVVLLLVKLVVAAVLLGVLDASLAKLRILALPGLLGTATLLAVIGLATRLWLPA